MKNLKIFSLCILVSSFLPITSNCQTTDFSISIQDISSPYWDTHYCPEDPDQDWNDIYSGAFGKDVNKLRTIPYSNNSVSNNIFLNNHTFWFSFGCCGQTFCADDYESSFVYTDDFWDAGSLYFPNVWIGHATIIWIDFLTQCESCVWSGDLSDGVWHKWEDWYDAQELSTFFPSYPSFDEAFPEFMMTVSCNIFSTYGCQPNEND